MARMRTIKPGFFTNDTLAELNPLVRIAFIGLWTIADREGRLDDRPKRIKVEIMPYDDMDMDSALQALHDSGFILRYAHDGHRYIQVLKFARHQSPHKNEQLSTIPAPYMHGTSTVQDSEEHHTTRAEQITDTDTDNSYTDSFVAADADDVTKDATQSSSDTSSEQKTPTGKKRTTAKASPAGAATFAPECEAFQLAAYLRDAILSHKPDANVPRDDKRLQVWAVVTDRMLRLDGDGKGRDPAEARALIDWATRDDFWAANILSPGSFRDHYDQLAIQRKRKANGNANGNGNGTARPQANGRKTGKSGAWGDHFAMNEEEYRRQMEAEFAKTGYPTGGTHD